jgi:hypothetical protein
MARIHRHCRSCLFHHLLRHLAQWCHWCHSPRTLPRHRSCVLGLLGLLHRHHIPRRPRRLLVRYSDYEWSEHSPRHDWRYLAVLLKTS